MPVVDNLWTVNGFVIILENETGVLSFDCCIVIQINGTLTLSSSTHSTPIFVIYVEKKNNKSQFNKKLESAKNTVKKISVINVMQNKRKLIFSHRYKFLSVQHFPQ